MLDHPKRLFETHADKPTEVRSAPDGAPFDVITTRDEAEALAHEWQQLADRSGRATLFQSPAWCLFVWRTLERYRGRLSFRPLLVVARRGGKLVFVFPLTIRNAFQCSIAEDLTEPFGQYSDALVADGTKADDLMDGAWAILKREGVDALMMRKVRADAAIAAWLQRKGTALGEVRSAPFVALSESADFASYHGTLKAKTRKNLRNYRNRLKRIGTLTHECVTDASTKTELTLRCLALRSQWLQQSGLSSTAFQNPAFGDIIRALADGQDGAPDVTVMRLSLLPSDGTASVDLAMQWGFLDGDRYYAFMSAKHPDYDDYSPGRLHLEDVVRMCAGEDMNPDGPVGVVDFMVPDMPYKSTFATGRCEVFNYGIAATLKGRGVVHGWHGFGRPALKAAYLAMPARLRRVATQVDARLQSSGKQ
ncbi:MAG: GNAT family N-acetyltransferase [Pseudomonadota bacterium]